MVRLNVYVLMNDDTHFIHDQEDLHIMNESTFFSYVFLTIINGVATVYLLKYLYLS